MIQRNFIEFNVKPGVGDLLFVNMNQPTECRFYRRRDSWDECYTVEFCPNSEDYHFYWGHNEHECGIIDATIVLLPSYSEIEWKQIDFNYHFPFNLTQIVESVERTISEQR